jgi:hypothetical protein
MVCLNGTATLDVSAADATTYSWRIASPAPGPGWTILADGPLIVSGQQVATVTGTATPSLHVQSAGVRFTALFRCAAGNPCSSVETDSALLTVAVCCGSADFNCDGDTGTDADIEAFFTCLAGVCPAAPCASTADFNSDGDSGTDADIEAFFRVLAGGDC